MVVVDVVVVDVVVVVLVVVVVVVVLVVVVVVVAHCPQRTVFSPLVPCTTVLVSSVLNLKPPTEFVEHPAT